MNTAGNVCRSERSATEVIDALTDLFILRGRPTFGQKMVQRSSLRRSGAGSKPLSLILRIDCWAGVGAKTTSIALGSVWKNGYCESFNEQMRDELLNRDIFYARREV